jgi:acyl-coenzyme A synthetase/AMP-(fatty) acid ligase
VLIPHRGVCNRLLWMQREFALDEHDVVLQKTPVTFDVSVWELFWPLLTGARLVFAEPRRHGDPTHLAEVVERHRVTTIHFVPTMLDALLATPGIAPRLGALRRVFTSGEALGAGLARAACRALPGAELHNLYGPTEASVDVTHWPCPRDFDGDVVPIGRAIANTSIWILDPYGQPAPIGVPGELYIGGVQLARGYINDPVRTAERFVTVSGRPERLYRTGDRARVLADGNVEFLGRLDRQVKIRGFRIELSEIEVVLREHPALASAVVAVVPAGDRTMLVGYVVARGDAPKVDELRAFVASRLPPYMVPEAFMALDELPASAHGKLDVSRLPVPAAHRPDLSTRLIGPRDELESTIASAWTTALQIDKVGVQDNFFDVGGTSLLLVAVHSSLLALDPTLELVELFQYPTIEGLAQRIGRGREAATAPTDLADRAELRRAAARSMRNRRGAS